MTDENDYIWLYGGIEQAIDPSPAHHSWTIDTIANSLGRVGRWTGHTDPTKPSYTVAQHSVIVSYLVEPGLEPEGLFHDAAEFVLGDITTPIKRRLGPEALKIYKELTAEWDEVIADRFTLDLSEETHLKVKIADRLAQWWEGFLLVGVSREQLRRFGNNNPSFGPDWGQDYNCAVGRLPASPRVMFEPQDANTASRAFLNRYYELRAKGHMTGHP